VVIEQIKIKWNIRILRKFKQRLRSGIEIAVDLFSKLIKWTSKSIFLHSSVHYANADRATGLQFVVSHCTEEVGSIIKVTLEYVWTKNDYITNNVNIKSSRIIRICVAFFPWIKLTILISGCHFQSHTHKRNYGLLWPETIHYILLTRIRIFIYFAQSFYFK